ncbi:SDR family oxidoreductase [Pseudoduganella violacea]|uniref:NAD(P)-dependent dehydrogenase (Short-subunit alcohol dehydrogenase family) n=1 Tax=Pseudoduganella violacea TaxID=1715466 RepID=A0A7W5B859_9BURK|nr:SDR family oxidoreductase [Pseudoduganella violacea]MBB3118218.1 NAD(P)-dependent dehydrogenase (short-subunit alcohol dehydrogenase family) [Pseudoduganella violacea]
MDKVVIVTGAGRGIGAAVARRVAREGYAVAVNYQRDAAAAESVVAGIRAAGGKALAVQADVAVPEQVRRLFATVERELGLPTALVNNAGITGRLGKFPEADPVMVEAVFRTNVLGLMDCTRAAIAAFRRGGQGGVVVNVSSTAAASGSPHEYVWYASSKAAVDGFTMGLGKELATEGIRVCGVAPGFALTDIHAAAGEPDRAQRVTSRIPMQRPAQPEEIAEAVAWMLSPAASYVTATTLRCGGGV